MSVLLSEIEISKLGSSDLLSLEIVIKEYNQYARGEDVMEIGFNTSTGYVYIALENGIQIASCFGQSAEFIVYDQENGNEHFFEKYNDALDMQYKIWA